MGKFESIENIHPFLKLHEGEWADVYKAYDASLGKNVLLKKLKSIFEHDPAVAERFEAEAILMAKVQHPNVVSVLSSGRSGSAVYFTAEFVEGRSLSELLKEGALPPALAVFMLREITKGLAAAHDKHIFHRDIKPPNVIVSDTGEVKLTDFGMASLFEAHGEKELRGTLGYIAPELLFEGVPRAVTDIFSLGVTFYETLSGNAAFRGESSRGIFDKVLNYDPIPLLEVNPKIGPDVINICRRALHKNPADRYQICKELLQDLDAILESIPDFDGRAESIRYMANPGGYVTQDAELVLLRTEPENHVDQSASQSNLSDTSKRRRFLMGSFLGICAIALFWGTATLWRTEIPGADDAPEEAKQVPVSNTPEVEVSLVDIQPPASQELPDSQAIQSELPNNTIAPPSITDAEPAEADTETIETEVVEEKDQPLREEVAPQAPPLANGEVELQCTPYCTVYIDDDSIGVAPPLLRVALPAGIHRLDLKHPVLPTYSTDLVVEAGKKDSLKIALRDYVGSVELNVNPWARVYIDDVFKGDIPPTQTFTLQPGEYVLRLEHDRGIWTDTLLVAAGERRAYRYNLDDLLKSN